MFCARLAPVFPLGTRTTTTGWWLEDYALYMTAKGLYEGKSYLEWPEPVRSHTPEAIRQLYAEHEAEIHF